MAKLSADFCHGSRRALSLMCRVMEQLHCFLEPFKRYEQPPAQRLEDEANEGVSLPNIHVAFD
jgi:hypothetical protein